MNEAFTIFDPTEQTDLIPSKIRTFKSNNTLLIVCLLVVALFAGYFMYKYYQSKDDKHHLPKTNLLS